jgi:hypothetical protein
MREIPLGNRRRRTEDGRQKTEDGRRKPAPFDKVYPERSRMGSEPALKIVEGTCFGGGGKSKIKAPHGQQQVAYPTHYFLSSVLIRVNQWLI